MFSGQGNPKYVHKPTQENPIHPRQPKFQPAVDALGLMGYSVNFLENKTFCFPMSLDAQTPMELKPSPTGELTALTVNSQPPAEGGGPMHVAWGPQGAVLLIQ